MDNTELLVVLMIGVCFSDFAICFRAWMTSGLVVSMLKTSSGISIASSAWVGVTVPPGKWSCGFASVGVSHWMTSSEGVACLVALIHFGHLLWLVIPV